MATDTDNIRSEVDNRKIARAYVVLALARDVASNYIAEKPAHAGLHPLLTMLDMTNGLLEEVLEHSMTQDIPIVDSEHEACSELLM
ncbi:MAG TPA: hypothetical protein VIG25_15415 [Pyrinomonadaceae bacterium]|jgi:hypothetical protein